MLFLIIFQSGKLSSRISHQSNENYDVLLIPKTHGFSVETLHRDQSVLYLFNNLSDL